MKNIAQYFGVQQKAILTLVTYLILSVTAVVQPWLSQVGAQKFNEIVFHPLDHAYDIVGVAVGIIVGLASTVRSLLNKDLHAGVIEDVKELK